MDITFIIPILNFGVFLRILVSFIPNAIYSLLLYNAINKNREDFEFSDTLITSTILFLVMNIALFFIPVISISNVAPSEEITASMIYLLFGTLLFVPFIILQGIALIIFGWKNKEHYNNFLFIAGILITIILVWSYISYLLPQFGLVDPSYTGINLLTIFYYNSASYLFGALEILFYVSFLIHGLIYEKEDFKNLGLIMIIIALIYTVINPILTNLIFSVEIVPL